MARKDNKNSISYLVEHHVGPVPHGEQVTIVVAVALGIGTLHRVCWRLSVVPYLSRRAVNAYGN